MRPEAGDEVVLPSAHPGGGGVGVDGKPQPFGVSCVGFHQPDWPDPLRLVHPL